MTEFEVFIFGCLNFVALVALLFYGLRKSARQFFYARRATLKKLMVVAAHERREARLKVARGRKLVASLEVDIAERRRMMAEGCGRECEAVLAAARRRGEQLTASAARQTQEERLRIAQAVRGEILVEAFRQAEAILQAAPEKDRRRAVEGGVAEIEALVRGHPTLTAGGAR